MASYILDCMCSTILSSKMYDRIEVHLDIRLDLREIEKGIDKIHCQFIGALSRWEIIICVDRHKQ
jgi:hypothetical protein